MNSKLTGEGDDEDEDLKKNIAIFAINFEHRDENQSCSACQEWVNERLIECESEKEWEWECVRVTFEHRHENKSCSACPECLYR